MANKKQKNQEFGYAGLEQPEVRNDKFYAGVMTTIDVIANILRNLKDPNISGVTFKFQGTKLIIAINVYEYPNEQVFKDLTQSSSEVIKWLKKRFKEETGKTLKMKLMSDNYDVVGAYTTNNKAKITYVLIFEIEKTKIDSEMNSLDDTGYGLKNQNKNGFDVA